MMLYSAITLFCAGVWPGDAGPRHLHDHTACRSAAATHTPLGIHEPASTATATTTSITQRKHASTASCHNRCSEQWWWWCSRWCRGEAALPSGERPVSRCAHRGRRRHTHAAGGCGRVLRCCHEQQSAQLLRMSSIYAISYVFYLCHCVCLLFMPLRMSVGLGLVMPFPSIR